MLLGAGLPHHVTGGFTSHRKFLADKEYGEALDTLVKACSDMLLVSPEGDKILVGKRKVHPQPDWWFVGGRIFPGETPTQSCSRLLRRELSLDVDPKRLTPVCCQSLAWGMREQVPKQNGTTDSQFVFSLTLTESERDKVVLDPKEYDDSQWLTPETIIAGDFHPALKFAVQSLLGARKLAELQSAVALNPDNHVEIAALAKDLVALSQARPPEGESAYRVRSTALQYEGVVTTSY